jgi:hypothetical protein
MLVVLPTLLLGAYYVFVAADIYESEARFLVRNRGGGGGGGDSGGARTGSLASAILGKGGGGEEARAMMTYLDSPAALIELRKDVDLIGLWRAPEADALARLWWETPQIEWLLWYFRRRVVVELDTETNVLKLRVQAFRPQDAQSLAQRILDMSEGRRGGREASARRARGADRLPRARGGLRSAGFRGWSGVRHYRAHLCVDAGAYRAERAARLHASRQPAAATPPEPYRDAGVADRDRTPARHSRRRGSDPAGRSL